MASIKQYKIVEPTGDNTEEDGLYQNLRTVENNGLAKYILVHLIVLTAWWLIYITLKPSANFLTYSLLHVAKSSNLGAALTFFFYEAPKIFLLFGIVIYIVGLLRSFISPEKVRQFLTGKKTFVCNILASLLGVVTPFSSCAAIPLFIGFLSAGVPLGITFSFLISTAMINEIALILLYDLLGWKITALYLVTGLILTIMAGFIIGMLHPDKYVRNWVKKAKYKSSTEKEAKINWHERILFAYHSLEILKRIWIFVLIGIVLGAVIHGFIPEKYMPIFLGAHSWWSIPLAILLGLPLYSNAAGIIPIVEVLINKGAAIGTALAFMMSVTALSFPEMLILRKILKPQLIYMFLIIATSGIVIFGYLFNWII